MSTGLLEKPGAPAESGAERQIVALHLAEEIYGVDIAHIHTVITPQAITWVPRTPPFVKGVMNLRGRILPVIDLRTRFGLPPLAEEKHKASRIVIVDVEGLTAGLIVDAVSEVLRVPETSIDPPSWLVASSDIDCITGIGRIPTHRRREDAEERLILLLDVRKALSNGPEGAEALKELRRDA